MLVISCRLILIWHGSPSLKLRTLSMQTLVIVRNQLDCSEADRSRIVARTMSDTAMRLGVAGCLAVLGHRSAIPLWEEEEGFDERLSRRQLKGLLLGYLILDLLHMWDIRTGWAGAGASNLS